jgi:hypothetical protein
MTDHTRPLLIGYFQEVFFSTPAEQATTRRLLEDFAAREGFTISWILFERYDQKWIEFERLIELARHNGVTTVAIPTEADLDDDQRRRLQAEAAAHVVVATTTP